MRIPSTKAAFLIASALLACAATARGQAPRTAILDTTGFWRIHQTLAPPVIDLEGTLEPILLGPRWLRWPSPDAPEGWMRPDFDDAGWLRATALAPGGSPYLARLRLRGRFTVEDVQRAADLRLALDFHGGAVVYLNGTEIARRHLGDGPVAPDALAEGYPREVFVNAADSLLVWDRRRARPGGDDGRRIDLRVRRLEDVVLPAALLREGANVLAVEIVRAPYHAVVDQKKDPNRDKRFPTPYDVPFNTCELWRVSLTAPAEAALASQAVRPGGLQVWNSDPMQSDFDLDFAGTAEPLAPVAMVAPRNGVACGKVVVGCDEPIAGLRATCTDLGGPAARSIPAAAVTIRYGVPWGYEQGADGATYSRYLRRPTLLGALEDRPRDVYPVREVEASRGDLRLDGAPQPVFGAVVPVWLTVRVPADAAPGRYSGRVTIETAGRAPLAAEVAVDVVDWRLADPKDFRTWVELIQFPDTLSLQYGVAPWSDEHFALIGRSFDHMAAVGSRVVYVPLIAETNFGNAESMVRWIDNGDGTYAFDLAPMERYLDVAAEHLGRPALVVFQAWDVYVGARAKAASATGGEARALEYLQERGAELGEGPIVTFVDPATGATRNREMPSLADPSAQGAWKSLFEQIRRRLEARGLQDAAALGCLTDAVPTKAEAEALAAVAPGMPWVGHSHHGFNHRAGVTLHGAAPICYETRVWHTYFSCDPDDRMYGWRNPFLIAYYERCRDVIQFPPTKWRHLPELAITGRQRGMGRIGADYWDVLTDARGRPAGPISRRYPHSSWRNLDLYTSLLAPGADGPVATTRLEALRQGVQECEARIFLEAALTDPDRRARLGDELAQRCQRMLDERLLYVYTSQSNLQLTGPEYLYATEWRSRAGINGHYWFLASGCQDRTRELFELAGAAARRLEGAD
ncbi:MAG: DUF4091 domain-containing protein [Planctomycetes bacterium]|nr:DUF4091 domain-containing protein [Planctomycetota bacterium]